MFDISKRLGWRPEPPDARDLKLGCHLALFRRRLPEQLPPEMSLREAQSPVRDQGDTSSCVGFALASMREYLEIVDKKTNREATEGHLSPLFIYNQAREREKTLHCDCGAYLRDGLKVLQQAGVPTENEFPFSPDNLFVKPVAGDGSYRHCIYAYLRVNNLQEAKAAIAMGLPVVTGLTLYENWELPIVWQTGLIPDPQGRAIGGHAVLIVGYHDDTRKLTYKNSWGPEWGDGGFFHTDYQYFEQNSSDAWTVLRWR